MAVFQWNLIQNLKFNIHHYLLPTRHSPLATIHSSLAFLYKIR